MKEYEKKQILDLIREKQFITVNELSQKLFLSPSSVRRKLSELEKNAEVKRTHGGVKLIENNNIFPTFTFRSHQNPIEKKIIAKKAVEFIHDGDVIFLDGSTSVFFVAGLLKDFQNITVITNGIDTLSVLSKYNINAYSTGGKISKENPSVLIGQNAINVINNYNANVCFFSTQSIQKNGDLFDCFEEENYIRQAMLKSSKTKISLCDSTKFGKTSPYKLCSLSDVDYLITDKNVAEYFTVDVKNKIIKT